MCTAFVSDNLYIRFNPLQPLMKHHVFQHIYLFFLIAFYGFTIMIQSLSKSKS